MDLRPASRSHSRSHLGFVRIAWQTKSHVKSCPCWQSYQCGAQDEAAFKIWLSLHCPHSGHVKQNVCTVQGRAVPRPASTAWGRGEGGSAKKRNDLRKTTKRWEQRVSRVRTGRPLSALHLHANTVWQLCFVWLICSLRGLWDGGSRRAALRCHRRTRDAIIMLLCFQLHAVVNYCSLGVQATGGYIWKIETVFCEVSGRRSLSIEASLFLIYSPPVAANEFLQDVWLLSSAVALNAPHHTHTHTQTTTHTALRTAQAMYHIFWKLT